MSVELLFVFVIVLLLFAAADIVVGVANDAVNFLNSAIGSRVAPFYIIMIIASLGVIVGVAFSGGMLEVARKGIFHPQFFTMPELITLFLAVMFTDILLLDLFNSYGLPTSTTVSLVFELIGAAVAMALFRVINTGGSIGDIAAYINTSKAMVIIFGILLSIVVAFCGGTVFQFITRLIFTFDYEKRLKRYGALWSGMAMAIITCFILMNGIKGSPFFSREMTVWVTTHSFLLMAGIFLFSAIVFQILILLFRINVLKIIVLVGTFALALAFASNDLVNFIGVPMAGLHAYQIAIASGDPMNVMMDALGDKVHTQNLYLILAGIIMILTLWLSKKARTVTQTEISLGQQDEGMERFESIWLSRKIVRMADSLFCGFTLCLPHRLKEVVGKRMNPSIKKATADRDKKPSFDMIRASVNLMISSAIISYGTSMKLPLSTTFVTFMVAMGTSFSDQAWGRESAVYRITGVLTVIGGWFMTALVAFIIAFLFAACIASWKVPGIILLAAVITLTVVNNHKKHKTLTTEKEETEIFNLRKVTNPQLVISATFDHLTFLLKEFRECFDVTIDALFTQDVDALDRQRKRIKKHQVWVNIITANVFKALRLQQKEDHKLSYQYAQTIRRLQKTSDGFRDIILRSYIHIANHHKGLLEVQITELKEVKEAMMDVLSKVETAFRNKDIKDYQSIVEQYANMRIMAERMNLEQILRIQENTSKTRLSILFYAIVGDCLMVVKQNIKLLEILNESFRLDNELSKSYVKLESH